MSAVVPPDSETAMQNPAKRKVRAQKENDPQRKGEVRRTHSKDEEHRNEGRCDRHKNANWPVDDVTERVMVEVERVSQAERASECKRLG